MTWLQLSMLTLFRMSTGEAWGCIAHDCMDERFGGTAEISFEPSLALNSFYCLPIARLPVGGALLPDL